MKSAATLRLIGNPHAYYPNLAKPLGGLTSAIFFPKYFTLMRLISRPKRQGFTADLIRAGMFYTPHHLKISPEELT